MILNFKRKSPDRRPSQEIVPLSSLDVGAAARIVRLPGNGPFRGRLLELGFVPGSRVLVWRRSPLRDPVEYEVRNTRICLRQSEAEGILVSSAP